VKIGLYDAVMTTLSVIGIVGVIVTSYLMNKHRREMRVYKRIRVEAGEFFPSLPEWLKNPKWLVKLFSGTTKLD
jgi:hypothetical protein